MDAICKQMPVRDHPADRDSDLPISKSGVPVGFRSTAGDTLTCTLLECCLLTVTDGVFFSFVFVLFVYN